MSIEIVEIDEKLYLHECWHCHTMVPVNNVKPRWRVFCEDCKEQYFAEKEETLKQYVSLKIDVMYERALRHMEKQTLSMSDYKIAAETVYDFAKEDPTKFDSSPEMMAAMELIRREIPVKMQYKLNRHRIDILIPSLKVALEIDGYQHQYKILQDSKRDVELVKELGVGWEVIRIPTSHIETNLKKLVPAIKALYNHKQELRRKNNGFIPKNFSKRDYELHESFEE